MIDVVRAFGVMLGPSLLLDGAAAASVGSTARAVVSGRRPRLAAAAGTALVVLYAVRVRPWMLSWGATPDEGASVLPGDELVPRAAIRSTMAVTIDAPPEEVWPWLAQIGQDRGGFYSYEWLENLAGCRMRNAERIHPEWQHREIGEVVLLHPRNGLPVAVFDPGRAVVLRGWGAFVLEPRPGGRTRLLARGRTAPGAGALYAILLVEAPHFLMQRRMLLGIRDRARRSGEHGRLA